LAIDYSHSCCAHNSASLRIASSSSFFTSLPTYRVQDLIKSASKSQTSAKMAMESMSAAFAGAFKSKRLVYRSMEDTDADRDWLWKNLWNNPVSVGLANLGTFVPPSQKNFKKDWEQITTKALVAVFICRKQCSGSFTAHYCMSKEPSEAVVSLRQFHNIPENPRPIIKKQLLTLNCCSATPGEGGGCGV
jgi:hypothetical protein